MALRLETFEYHGAFPGIHLIINGRGLRPHPLLRLKPHGQQLTKQQSGVPNSKQEQPIATVSATHG